MSELPRALNVSASTYYYSPAEPSLKEARMVVDMKVAFKNAYQTYGKRRLHQVLLKQGDTVGVVKVCSLMKKYGLTAVATKKKHVY